MIPFKDTILASRISGDPDVNTGNITLFPATSTAGFIIDTSLYEPANTQQMIFKMSDTTTFSPGGANGRGTDLLILGSSGFETGAGGGIGIAGGNGLGYGSDITIQAGYATASDSGMGGRIVIISAYGFTEGGSIDLVPGDSATTKGSVRIYPPGGGSNYAGFDTSLLSDIRTFAFPDNSGTLALLSDITGGSPAGSDGCLQYNNGGVFGGSSKFFIQMDGSLKGELTGFVLTSGGVAKVVFDSSPGYGQTAFANSDQSKVASIAMVDELVFNVGFGPIVALTILQTGEINFNNAYTFPTTDGTSGQALVTDGSGVLSFQTVASGGGGFA